jgi:hypothetical protein
MRCQEYMRVASSDIPIVHFVRYRQMPFLSGCLTLIVVCVTTPTGGCRQGVPPVPAPPPKQKTDDDWSKSVAEEKRGSNERRE